jgi:membrane protein YdbS with pleckstrin-like domain
MVAVDMQTKPCPFCAETIQAAAIKCRFCGEFLNSEKAKALQAEAELDAQPSEDQETDGDVLFADRPSLFGMVPAVVKASVVLVPTWLLVKLPLEALVNNLLGLKLTANQAFTIGRYRVLAGFGLIIVVLLVLLLKAMKLRMTWYEVTAERIEWDRGILDRKVDNIDMFRVIDLKMRRSLFDCIFGIGTVVLTTTDKSDPEFIFEKVRYCRDLYDIIKKASLEAGRKTGVVHLE